MKKIICILLSSILSINIGSAQQMSEEALHLVEQADLDAQKSYTRNKALKGYLSACRLFIKEKEGKKNSASILRKVNDLIAEEKYLTARDGAIVDSLLEETYEIFRDDASIYLPLLESCVLKASGTNDKYRRTFDLYDRAISIRTDNSLLKGPEYEALLRWYANHLYNRKEISKDEKLALYTKLWNAYQENNQGKDSLDIKLLESYRAACGFNGNEELKVELDEIKSQYIKKYKGENSEDYLKCLQSLIGDYYSLAQKEAKKGITDNAKVKELKARIDAWTLLVKRDEIYDDAAQISLSSLVYGLVNEMNDTTQAKALSLENIEKMESKFGKNSKQYIEALDILLNGYDMYDEDRIPILEEKLELEKTLYGDQDYRTQGTSSALNVLYSKNHRMSDALSISELNAKDDDYQSLLALASQQTLYGKNRDAIETYNKLMSLCVTYPSLKGIVFFTSVLGPLNCLHTIKDTKGMLEFGRKWMNEESFTLDEQMFVFSQVIGMASLPGSSNEDAVAFADEFLLSHNSIMNDPEKLSKVLEYKASVLYGMLKFDKAIDVIRQILTIQNPNTPQGKLNFIKYSSELETCMLAKNDFKSALAANNKNRQLIMSIPGFEDTMEYCSMCARACIYYDQLKEYDKIGDFSEIVRKMEQRQKTQLDPSAIFEVNNFSAFLWMLNESSIVGPTLHYYCSENKITDAKSFVSDYVAELEGTIRFSLGQLDSQSTTAQYGYMNIANDYLTGIAMLDLTDDELAQQTFDYTLLYKQAFLASEIQMRAQILNSENDAIKNKFTELQTLKNTAQTYQQAGLDATLLNEQIASLEKQLLEDSKAYGDFTAALNVKWRDILNKLEAGAAVVEFISYEDMTNGKRNIGACILSESTQKPILIPIGSEESFKNDDIYTSSELGKRIWEPIIEKLKGVKTIYFSPSGIFYDIAIENLPYKEGLISNQYNLIRVSSSRQICGRIASSGTKSLVFGGLDYASSNDNRQETSGSRGAVSGIPFLPGTKTEAKQIHDIMSHNNVVSSLYTGEEGTESRIKQMEPLETKVLHIATHGFFRESPEKYDNIVINPNTQEKEDDVLNNSGLLMAGAQLALEGKNHGEGIEDGILTAQEISTLDLRGLDLVTLSACETAKGDITGDGVFGLQRGFKKAGANSILMSLWKVDDDATCKLMTEFYSNWIEKKMTKHKALENAKRTVRETKGWEHPKYWAAFILLDALD